MLFKHETMQLHLLDVMYWQENSTESPTKARDFDALSIRMESDAHFETSCESIMMHSRDIAFVPAGCGYTRHCTVDKMIVFHFRTEPDSDNPRIRVIRDANYDVLYPMFRKALTEWTEKRPGYYYRTISLLYRIIGELCKQPEADTHKIHPITARATSIMKQEFSKSFCTVSSVAKRLNVSEAYLRRMFQLELGQAPKQYLNMLRMNRAKDLLNAGYDSIVTISEKVGFTDPKNFATAYKKHFGYPPSKQSYDINDF